MEKNCLTCEIVFETKKTNRKYCSVKCQHESYRKTKVIRIERKCLHCGKTFEITENDVKLGRGKYCCRTCKDNHQKFKYLGKNNPMFGKTSTPELSEKKSKLMKEKWLDEEYRKKIKNSQLRFYEKKGYWPGSDPESKKKRAMTMKLKYGVYHNWNGKYGKRNCDLTTKKKYGISAVEMLIKHSHKFGKKTDIEILFEKILQKLQIPHQLKFRIYNEDKSKFWFKEYDFLIEGTNFLIEVDGDYWHGNEKIFQQLSELQILTKKNDSEKEEFAIRKGYTIKRFWGSEIQKNPDKITNELNSLWEKLK